METVDVVVVGAGFSGLAAARKLVAAGLDVAVLEALPVVGGRTRTTTHDATWLELGGQWASARHSELLALAAGFGVSTFETPTAGTSLIVHDGQRADLDDNPAAGDLVEAVGKLDAMARSVASESPWRSPAAAANDAEMIDVWAARQVSNPVARLQLVTILQELMTVPARELSVLTILQSAQSSGTLAAAMGIENGAQELRFMGGMQQIAQRIAEDLGPIVRTEWPVSAVVVGSASTMISGRRGNIRARRVIVALAPSMAKHLTFDPPLPSARVELHQRMPMGSVIKVNVVYDRPFWRDDGLSGLVLDFDGPMAYGVDNSSPDQAHGVLTSFFAGAAARRFSASGESSRRQSVLAQAIRWFGPKAGQPIAYVDHDWIAERWIDGGYSGVMQPGAWQTCGPALRPPVGPVHWAGSETATEWTGYVEGAVRSGHRAASEVLLELNPAAQA